MASRQLLSFRFWIILFFTALSNRRIVRGYSDLRGEPCMSDQLRRRIPANRVNWRGQASMKLSCNPGYDLPLNIPPGATFTCLPDGSPWKPNYVPDCNEEIFPKTLELLSSVILSSSQCEQAKESVNTQKDEITFPSGKKLDFVGICRQQIPSGCNLKGITFYCDKHMTDATLRALKVKGPVVIMKITVTYNSSKPWSNYHQTAQKLSVSLVQTLDLSPSESPPNVKIVAHCDNRTTGVLRDGRQAVCRGCSLGHYLDHQKKECLPCQPGFYGDAPLMTFCQLCPSLLSMTNLTLWEEINAKAVNRSFTISWCPALVRKGKDLYVLIPEAGTHEEYLMSGKKLNPDDFQGSGKATRPAEACSLTSGVVVSSLLVLVSLGEF